MLFFVYIAILTLFISNYLYNILYNIQIFDKNLTNIKFTTYLLLKNTKLNNCKLDVIITSKSKNCSRETFSIVHVFSRINISLNNYIYFLLINLKREKLFYQHF